jgi:NRPS condensation-like uncharacterized protein
MRVVSGYAPLTVADVATRYTQVGTQSAESGAPYDALLLAWLNRPLDPIKEWPWRVLLLRGTATESSLVFTFHHSATDGLGALRFITEVIRRYNGTVGDPPVGGAITRKGDELVALARDRRLRTTHFRVKMISSLCHRFAIAPLSPHGRVCRAAARPAPELYLCQAALKPHELRQIRSKAKSIGATVNDVLLAACFKTMDQWNDVHGRPNGKMAIMVPVDLGQAMPCAGVENRVSFISVSTTSRERCHPDELLRTVSKKTSHLLRNGIEFSIVYAVHYCCRLPTPVPRAVARFLLATRLYLDSILVTNVGLIWPEGIGPGKGGARIGGAAIASVVVIPPVVSPMGISLSAGTYNGHLHVALTYKTSQLSYAQARLFLNLYLHEMRSYRRTAEGVLAPQVTERPTRETAQAR